MGTIMGVDKLYDIKYYQVQYDDGDIEFLGLTTIAIEEGSWSTVNTV